MVPVFQNQKSVHEIIRYGTASEKKGGGEGTGKDIATAWDLGNATETNKGIT